MPATSQARLVRAGRTYARGRLAALTPQRRVARGSYTLRVGIRSFRVRIG
jgi:hypothetical protein